MSAFPSTASPALFLAPLILGGCFTSWDFRDGGPPTGDCQAVWFPDADDDGWGTPGSQGERLCEADIERGLTARNDRDCDDDDVEITGRIGSICPERLTVGDTTYFGLADADVERVAVYGDSATVWASAAEDACGPWGWGGSLANLPSAADRAALTGALDAVIGSSDYAAFVGVEHDGSGWVWRDDASSPVANIDFCDGLPPDPASFDTVWTGVALVHDSDGWCLGMPSRLGPPDATDGYGIGWAHFICERPTPNPEDYPVWTLEGDTGT